jgi:uncharacterized membrane protein YhaH (DUF805 family)
MGTNNFYKYQGSKSGNEETGFFNTMGRISRIAFWLRLLLVLGIYLVSCLLVYCNVYEEDDSFHQYILPFLLVVFLLIQGAKRMHDVDRTGWAFLIPIYNVYLSLLPGTLGNNSFGVDPSPPKSSEYFEDLDSFQKNSSGSLGDDAPITQSPSFQQAGRFNLPVKYLLLFFSLGILILAIVFREELFGCKKAETQENVAPKDITLSSYEVMENKSPGTEVGTFAAIDAEEDDSNTYALVSGQGGTDNGSFAISGKSLTTTERFDFESKDRYSIRVQVMDGKGGVFALPLTIAVSDDVSDNRKEKGGLDPTPQPGAPGIFYCIGKGEPIRMDQVGNGVCDCPDGSDERPGTCK